MRAVLLSCLYLLAVSCRALTVDPKDADSVRAAAKVVARDLVEWYHGNETGQTPGLLPPPYYWWAAGAMFGSLVDYWYYTGDDTYNEITTQGLLFQVGANQAFMPENQTASLGNDDQAFWGLTSMAAAEQRFPNPPADQPQWLALAQAVFNTQAPRWNLDNTCGGGLKWQIFPFNKGYNYKNSISNGCFFNLAARLGMYTGNATYFEWANRAYDWTTTVGLINPAYTAIYDGADDLRNCSAESFDRKEWTYNAGIFLYGAAVMWNQTTGDEKAMWESRVHSHWQRTRIQFFIRDEGIMYESACESKGRPPSCNTDQTTFKAYLARWMTSAAKVAPFLSKDIEPLLETSAVAAAGSCTGGDTGTKCGMKWFEYGNDGNLAVGVGQQMNALEVIQSCLANLVAGPVGNGTGATSVGDPGAGTDVEIDPTGHVQVSTADRGGAWFLTVMMMIFMLGGGWFMISDG